MVSTCKRHQKKRLLSHLNESLNDFVIGTNSRACVAGDHTVEPQSIGLVDNNEGEALDENSASHIQVP